MTAFKDLFHGIGNAHLDLARVGLGVGLVATIGLQAWAILKGQNFDPSSFSLGYSAILAGGAGGIALKDRAATAAATGAGAGE